VSLTATAAGADAASEAAAAAGSGGAWRNSVFVRYRCLEAVFVEITDLAVMCLFVCGPGTCLRVHTYTHTHTHIHIHFTVTLY